ncbi:conserved hypothetical protein [Ricinus communis]|uniref:Uncharacterized protein n=1 Tax=Ricinus communis TaxID=3988 RepID=B9T4R2_RICCO|nr:conserved hypothetical protein [Ricinus communis]
MSASSKMPLSVLLVIGIGELVSAIIPQVGLRNNHYITDRSCSEGCLFNSDSEQQSS